MTTTNTLPNSQAQFHSHIESTIHCGVVMPNSEKDTGATQPPRNITAVSVEIRIMLAYSARKNIANAMPEYSTM